jgi:NitT/TauT family transport system substrate-binding protein
MKNRFSLERHSRSLTSCIFAFLISLTLIVSCTQSKTATPVNSSASTNSTPTTASGGEMKIAFLAWPGCLPWQVAQEAEIFKANKLSVALKWFDGLAASNSALVAGQVDANNQTLIDTLIATAKGAEQVVVLTTDNSTGSDQVIVAPEIKTVADLKGKKVAVEEGSVDHYLLLLGLKKAGLSAKDIKIVPLTEGDAAAAFAVKKVDAVATFAPYTVKAMERAGSQVLFSSKDYPGAISDHLVFTRKFVDQHPDQVQAAVDSWFATLDYISKNKDKADAIMAKRASITVSEHQSFASGVKMFSLQENLQAFQSGNNLTSLPFAAKNVADFLVETKLAEKKPDLSKIFDDRFVKAHSQQVEKLQKS